MRSHSLTFATVLTIACSAAPSALGDVSGFGGSVVFTDPPASILHNQWESNTEIRGWFERETTLVTDLTLGHVNPGLVNDVSQLVGGVAPAGTTVQSYMVRLDPIGQGPVLLTGFITFDTPILGVFIGSQLGPTDSLLGRPGVAYNQNQFRGLELEPGSLDWFEISVDRFRIDFAMEVGEWTDDIRIVTAVPSPSAAALMMIGCLTLGRRRR